MNQENKTNIQGIPNSLSAEGGNHPATGRSAEGGVKGASGTTDWFEIFEPGDYAEKGNYSPGDLNDMAAAINNGDHVVPIVIGHAADPQNKWDKPLPAELADGALNAARIQDNRLQVKARVSDRVKDYFDDNRLHTWSAGIYKNFKGTGKKAVRHLAALGKTPPHLKGLNYTPKFTFSEDTQNGEFNEITFTNKQDDYSNTSKGELNMDREAQLEKENEELRKQLDNKNSASFDELQGKHDDNVVELDKVRKEKEAEKKRADEAETKLADETQKSAFSEIESDLAVEIKKGLKTPMHDKFRALRAIELGLVKDGVATFAEGQTSTDSASDLIKELRETEYVPTEQEGDKAISKLDLETFSEDDIEKCHTKRMELADEHLKKALETNKAALFHESAQAIQDQYPELYPDILN